MGHGGGDYSLRDQAVDSVFESGESRVMVMRRVESFANRYTTLRQAAPIAIAALVVALGVISMVVNPDAQAKLIMLSVLLVVVVLIFCACIAYEFRYDNMRARMEQADIRTDALLVDRVVLEPERARTSEPEAGELEADATQEAALNEIDVSNIAWDDSWVSTPDVANVEDTSQEIDDDKAIEDAPEVEDEIEPEIEVEEAAEPGIEVEKAIESEVEVEEAVEPGVEEDADA